MNEQRITALTNVLLCDLQCHVDDVRNARDIAFEHRIAPVIIESVAYAGLLERVEEIEFDAREDFAINGLHVGNALLMTAAFNAFAHLER